MLYPDYTRSLNKLIAESIVANAKPADYEHSAHTLALISAAKQEKIQCHLLKGFSDPVNVGPNGSATYQIVLRAEFPFTVGKYAKFELNILRPRLAGKGYDIAEVYCLFNDESGAEDPVIIDGKKPISETLEALFSNWIESEVRNTTEDPEASPPANYAPKQNADLAFFDRGNYPDIQEAIECGALYDFTIKLDELINIRDIQHTIKAMQQCIGDVQVIVPCIKIADEWHELDAVNIDGQPAKLAI